MADRQADIDDSQNAGTAEAIEKLDPSQVINFDELLKSNELSKVAAMLTEGAMEMSDFLKKDVVDRFLDFIFYKVQTGNVDIPSLVFPTKRMLDGVLEKKIAELINVHLFPEILLRLLKFFTRNIHDSDANLYIANLIYSEDIIKGIYEAYRLFRKDIFISDRNKRAFNVKTIQQFSQGSDNKQSSPLDAAARLKYILEFFLLKYNLSHIFTKEDLALSRMEDPDTG
jgi:hypothetical protein